MPWSCTRQIRRTAAAFRGGAGSARWTARLGPTSGGGTRAAWLASSHWAGRSVSRRSLSSARTRRGSPVWCASAQARPRRVGAPGLGTTVEAACEQRQHAGSSGASPPHRCWAATPTDLGKRSALDPTSGTGGVVVGCASHTGGTVVPETDDETSVGPQTHRIGGRSKGLATHDGFPQMWIALWTFVSAN